MPLLKWYITWDVAVLVAAYPGAAGCVYVHVYCCDFLLSMCLPFKAMNTKWWDEILMHKHTKTQCEQNTAGNLLVCPEIKGQFTPEMMVNSICTMHILPAITHLKFLLSALSIFWFHFQKPTKHVFFGEVLLQHPSKNYSKSHNYQMNMCRIIMVAGNCFKHAYFVWILFFCCSNSSFLPEGLIKSHFVLADHNIARYVFFVLLFRQTGWNMTESKEQ